MKVTKTITEEVPFNWDDFKYHLSQTDWFDPKDHNEWTEFIKDHCEDYLEYSEEDIKEVEKHRIDIADIMQKRREREVPDELYYYIGRALEDLVENDNEYKITEEEIHDYITNWFKEREV